MNHIATAVILLFIILLFVYAAKAKSASNSMFDLKYEF